MKIFTPLPEEYVASALKRGNELLGIKSIPLEDYRIKTVPRGGYGYSPGDKYEYRDHAEFTFPPLFTDCNITNEVLKNHTLYPLTAALGRSRVNTNVTPTSWRIICPDCVVEDSETHGTAYIHRRHVQPSVRVCSIHGAFLLETCPTCMMPISKHEISSLGLCSKKYKNMKRAPNSQQRLYSKFISDLLHYSGKTIPRHVANWCVNAAISVRHGIYDVKEESLILIAKRELDLKIRSTHGSNISDDTFTILAFLGCVTGARYMELITKENSINLLSRELDALRHAFYIKN